MASIIERIGLGCASNLMPVLSCLAVPIDQIGGWSSIGTIGSKYGQGYELDAVREQLDAVKIC